MDESAFVKLTGIDSEHVDANDPINHYSLTPHKNITNTTSPSNIVQLKPGTIDWWFKQTGPIRNAAKTQHGNDGPQGSKLKPASSAKTYVMMPWDETTNS